MHLPKTEAVLFDLFDTLVLRSDDLYFRGKAEMASLVGVAPEMFIAHWRRLGQASILGQIDTSKRARLTLASLGVAARPSTVSRLVSIEKKNQESAILFDSVPALLQTLRGTGFKLALVSNLSHAGRHVIDKVRIRELFDTVVFSFEVGVVKPNPAIYKLAIQHLGVEPERCIYVGDGNDRELDGAHSVGMTTVLIRQDRNGLLRNADSRYFDVEIERLGDLPVVIERIGGSGQTGPPGHTPLDHYQLP